MVGSDAAAGLAGTIDLLPEAVLLVDDGVIVHANPQAERLLGRSRPELHGLRFPPTAAPAERDDTDAFEWEPTTGDRREISFRRAPLPSLGNAYLVTLQDVSLERREMRLLSAVARTAARQRAPGTVQGMLDAIAHEIVQAEAISGVQIFTLDSDLQRLRVMGSAGFRYRPDFFERLAACERLGADLRQFEAMRTQQPVVVPHRSERVMRDPAWAPFHDYYRDIAWDSFACVPIVIRSRSEGVLNIFSAPGQEIDRRMLEFLISMADQAAVAIEYAALLQRERDSARQVERARLAADLHDSIVQHVFSVGMQAQTITLMADRGADAAAISPVADEILQLSRTVLSDLRAVVDDLRPRPASLSQLEQLVREVAAGTMRRSPLCVEVATDLGQEPVIVDGALVEDAYRVLTEALHNVVKHAHARSAAVTLRADANFLHLDVSDDGTGLEATTDPVRAHGLGIETMRERVARWGGKLVLTSDPASSGTTLHASIPLSGAVPSPRPVQER